MIETKAIFITGGAGGMGLATGQRFAQAGWRVGLFDLDAAALAAAKAEIGSDAVMTGTLDVTDAEAFSKAVAAFSAWSGGRMDILFNNGTFIQISSCIMRCRTNNLHPTVISLMIRLCTLKSR